MKRGGNMKNYIIALIIMLAGFASTAHANELTQVGSGKAGALATLKVDQNISRVIISCTDGAVTVKQIKVVNGADETPFNQQATLKKGARQQFTVGNAVRCEKLLIATEGQGSFDVHVRP
jgi:hypothetical protein